MVAEEVVAGDGGKAEEEEVDGGEDVGGGEGAPVGGEVSPHLHLGYWPPLGNFLVNISPLVSW